GVGVGCSGEDGDGGHRPMVMVVIEVNWQINARGRSTSPSAISLKRRSSRPLAANRNITVAAAVKTSASTSMSAPSCRWSAPEVGAVACGRVQLAQVGLGVLARHRAVCGDDVDE